MSLALRALSWEHKALSWARRALSWTRRALSWARRALSWARRALSWARRALCWARLTMSLAPSIVLGTGLGMPMGYRVVSILACTALIESITLCGGPHIMASISTSRAARVAMIASNLRSMVSALSDTDDLAGHSFKALGGWKFAIHGWCSEYMVMAGRA